MFAGLSFKALANSPFERPVSQNFYLLDDQDRIQDVAYSDAGIEKMLIRLSRDPAKFKSALKIG